MFLHDSVLPAGAMGGLRASQSWPAVVWAGLPARVQDRLAAPGCPRSSTQGLNMRIAVAKGAYSSRLQEAL